MGPSSANGIASSKQDEELMNLTLQLRNRKNEEKYAKFHGDNLIGVSGITVFWLSIINIYVESN
jgi:hypothetical protein